MLDPRGRQLLLSSLRPPEGFRFDSAVGTTFSLDLIALLTAPLAFAMFDWQDDEGRLSADPAVPTADPLALLESLRRCADRIHIFCQAGQIKVPPANQRLLAYLEQAVVEVQPPAAKEGRQAVFHPKVWAIRYLGANDAVRYRLLCLSRNLTFDRSWDTVLTLDGEVAARKNGFSENRELAEFIAGLPGLALRPNLLTPKANEDAARIAEELRRVKWELPEHVEELRFWPLGMNGKKSWPFADRIDRLLVISPFITEKFLKDVGIDGQEQFIVSRPESLRVIAPNALKDKWKCFTLNDGLEASALPDDEVAALPAEELSGLHAKVFVADAGWKAHIWTGSANATTAAFAGNVEFLVELIGKKAKLGIDATIGEQPDSSNLRSMLAEFVPASESVKLDPDQVTAEALADAACRVLCGMTLRVRLTTHTDGGAGFTTNVESDAALTMEHGVSVRCRPIMLPSADAKPLLSGGMISATFGPHAAESISSFVSFAISAKVGGVVHSKQFVLNLPLIGAPVDRKERLLRDLLRDSKTLLRFLLLLLSDDPEKLFEELRELAANPEASAGHGREDLLPLLEHLLSALHRHPEKVDQVHRLIEDLRKTPEGRSILSPELEAVWGPISRVRGTPAVQPVGGAR